MNEDMDAAIKLSSKYESLVRQQLQKESVELSDVTTSQTYAKDPEGSGSGFTPGDGGWHQRGYQGGDTSSSSLHGQRVPSLQLGDSYMNTSPPVGQSPIEDVICDDYRYVDPAGSSVTSLKSNPRPDDLGYRGGHQVNIETWLAGSAVGNTEPRPAVGTQTGGYGSRQDHGLGLHQGSSNGFAETSLPDQQYHDGSNSASSHQPLSHVPYNPDPSRSGEDFTHEGKSYEVRNRSEVGWISTSSDVRRAYGSNLQNGHGVQGSHSQNGHGVQGSHSQNGHGVQGSNSHNGHGVHSHNGRGVQGSHSHNGNVTEVGESHPGDSVWGVGRYRDRQMDRDVGRDRSLQEEELNVSMENRAPPTSQNGYSSLPLDFSHHTREYEARVTRHRDDFRETSDSFSRSATVTDYLSDQGEETRQLRREKEILAAEVVRLRDRVEELGGAGVTTSHISASINTYQPNNPQTLQRKIEDLECQIQDLQEANESAVLKLSEAEKKIAQLERENRTLSLSSRSYLPRDSKGEESRFHRETWDQSNRHDRGSRQSGEEVESRRSGRYREEVVREEPEVRPAYTRPSQRLPQPSGDLGRPSSAHGFYQGPTGVHSEGRLHGTPADRRHHQPTSDRHQSPGQRGGDRGLDVSIRSEGDHRREIPRTNHFPDPRVYEDGLRLGPPGEWRGGDPGHSLSPRSSSSEYRHLPHLTPPRPRDHSEKHTASSQKRVYGNRSEHSCPAAPSRLPPPGITCTEGDDTARSTSALSDCSDSTAALVYTGPLERRSPQTSHHKLSYPHHSQHVSHTTVSHRPVYPHDREEWSDTETEVLLYAPPPSAPPHSRQARPRHSTRERAMDTDKSIFKRRSRSLDFRESRGHQSRALNPNMMSSSSGHSEGGAQRFRSLERTNDNSGSLVSQDPSTSAGFRSVSPTPIATQRNKPSQRSAHRSALMNSTTGLKPLAPRSPNDIGIDDIVKFSRQGGKISQGSVKYIGHLPGRGDVYLGVELERDEGKHDGVFEGVRYFQCKPNKAVFVAFNKVVMAWTYPRSLGCDDPVEQHPSTQY